MASKKPKHHKATRALLRRDVVLKKVIQAIGPCTHISDSKRSIFEALIRAVAHQQLNGRAAEKILSRFIELFPTKDANGFPLARSVLRIDSKKLRSAGLSESKVRAIKDIALHEIKGDIPTKKAAARMSDNQIIESLLPLRGVGRWTAEMILIFTLGRTDVLPVDDFGIREGYRIAFNLPTQPRPKDLSKIGERWSPHRTVASWYLWRVADQAKIRNKK